MQTFLPYSSFIQSARTLDQKRLGKQRAETLQLLKAANRRRICLALDETPKGAWINHPAGLMWSGYERALILYGVAICEEWRSRGYKDTCLDKIYAYWDCFDWNGYPEWLGNHDFHRSHRSNLLAKNPDFYLHHFDEPDDLPYIWPA